MKHIIATILLLSATAVSAQTYKCTVNGRTIYADAPCGANARRADALQDHLTEDQRNQRLLQSIKERSERNSIDRRNNAEFNAQQRALERQAANEAAANQAREQDKKRKCDNLEYDMKQNQRAVARYQQFGWQQPLTQRENELKQNRESWDRDCR